MIGSRYRHFEIERLLGTGGMGEVYLAIDMNLERRVALKFLPRSLTSDPVAQGRLLDEARSCARLQHPNIAVIHSVEEDGGVYAICMEYVEGANLREILANRRLDVRRIVEIALGMARGIAAAHDHGIIHRDIKPANVVITGRGEVKVMDFGLALRPRRSVETTGPESYGTVAYMSPEQARGQELTPATDIFSFGSVLYQMVTGRLPFKGENDLATLYAIISDEPPSVRELRRDVPPGLERLITACLQKDPERRPESMDEIVVVLQRLSGSVKRGPHDLISELTTGLETESLRRRHSRRVHPLAPRAMGTDAPGGSDRSGSSPPPFSELELRDPSPSPGEELSSSAVLSGNAPATPSGGQVKPTSSSTRPAPGRDASTAMETVARTMAPAEEPFPLIKARLSTARRNAPVSRPSEKKPSPQVDPIEASLPRNVKPWWKTVLFALLALAIAAGAVLALQFLVIQTPPETPAPPVAPTSSRSGMSPRHHPPVRHVPNTPVATGFVEPLPEMIELELPPLG